MSESIICPVCTDDQVAKNGKTPNGEQRYICKNQACEGKSFKLAYTYHGWHSDIGERIIDARAGGAGIREIARELNISKQKVQEMLQERDHKMACGCRDCH